MRTLATSMFLLLVTQMGFAADTTATQPTTPPAKSVPAAPVMKSDTTFANHQSEKMDDVKITQAVRKALMHDQSLSNYAKNVQIITKDGAVVLKGYVANTAEIAKVEAAAKNAAGVSSVQNSLQVIRK